jgi:soluble lytic murein transglycosylase-like protein
MTAMRRLALFACALCAPVAAGASGTEQAEPGNAARARHDRAFPVPAQLTPAQRAAYRAIFADLSAGNWAGAIGRLDEMREGPLHDVVRAQLFTMTGSPRVELEPLLILLARAPELPQAGDLARLARLRGATILPPLPAAQRLVGLRGQPRRQRPAPTRGESLAQELDRLIQPLVLDDKPAEAEAILLSRGAELSLEARTEFQQRIAWTYYREGFHREALRLAGQARLGPGDWAVQGDWVAGLAAWQLGDCAAAEASFLNVARRTADSELAAAGHYWASRASLRCGHPERVQAQLRAAANNEETFYGLLAESALGVRRPPAGEAEVLTQRDWAMLAARPNVRAAVALLEAGETGLAEATLRHQARIGAPGEHIALTRLAARLNLPALQMYLAHNAPSGIRPGRHDRYPAPDWRPHNGWQVDQALAYAHALQESNFQPNALSHAGARGLMQVRPGTAGDLVRWGRAAGDPNRLNDPATNLTFGQAYMGYLRDQSGTDALLPRVIAAYNAGPGPIATWTAEGVGAGDPLLYIESLPYWETRGYLPIIFRNYWMYEYQPADRSPTRRALAQGLWPRFPGTPGPTAVRLAPTGSTAGTD